MSERDQTPARPVDLDRRAALKLSGAAVAATLLAAPGLASATPPIQRLGLGRGQRFDQDWRFSRQQGEGLQAPGLVAGQWRSLDLPHDWSLDDLPDPSPPDRVGPFDKQAEGGVSTGYTLGGEGWYRKTFRLDGAPADARVEIVFHGVAVTSDVWINGRPVGGQLNAYAPFALDLTPFLDRGGDNLIAVRVRNLGRNSRWYAGSGIYRPVEIDVLSPANRFARWGASAWTRRIADGVAQVDLTVAVATAGPGAVLRSALVNGDGEVAAEVSSPAQALTRQALQVRAPRLWSPATPELYTLVTELVRQGVVEDRIEQDFGLRIITMDPQQGLLINGVRHTFRGGCIHHDNGVLGAASFADADERRVRLLKARGFNAIRSSHNPASASLRAACDRQGMLLIEEAFDAWHVGKLPDDFSVHFVEHWKEQLAATVRPAINSPSVVMWSIGNEIPDRSTPEGIAWSWKLANAVHELDPTRPVTAAINQFIGHTVAAAEGTARPGRAGEPDQASTVFLDVAGYNYRLGYMDDEHQRFPGRIIYAAETYPKDAYDYEMRARNSPWMLGEFVWTAMDYLGEAGIGLPTSGVGPSPVFPPVAYPVVGAFCGDLDLIGDQKPQSLWRDVVWGVSPLEIVVQRPLPPGHSEWLSKWGWSDELKSWTWPGQDGRPVSVRLFTSGDRVQLRLNGAIVADQAVLAKDKMRVAVDVSYAPGVLEAIAWRDGREIGRRRLMTTGAPARLRLKAERPRLPRDRNSLGYVGVEVLDAAGRPVVDAALPLSLTVSGPAELIGLGSASPLAVGSFRSGTARTWHGRALAVLRPLGDAGAVRVQVRSPGLLGDAASLRT